jgi:hypothetical protein
LPPCTPRCPGMGPVEGWLIETGRVLGFVKGCFQPLPLLVYTPRIVDGVKTWDPSSVPRAWTRCFDFPVPVADPGRARLVSPVEAKRLLRACRSPACRAARLLLEELEAAAGSDRVGVTGGLSYRPESAGDVDLVVYGWRQSLEAYRRLRELREEGLTGPHLGGGHGWGRREEELHQRLSSRRLLFGTVGGVEYNVRLVPCEKPSPCARVRSLGEALIRARLCGGVGYTTPAVYTLCGTEAVGEVWPLPRLLITYRLRYTELPLGALVEVDGALQEQCGMPAVTPDHGGYLRLLEEAP